MSAFLDKLPRFPTAVIGSLPRPAWLLDVLQDYLAGRLSRAEWDRACDRAVPFAKVVERGVVSIELDEEKYDPAYCIAAVYAARRDGARF